MSFRATIAPAYLFLALSAAWLVRLGASPEARFPVQAARPYDFLAEIRRERPDLILVGNSMLHANVDRPQLQRALSKSAGRPVKVLFATEAAAGAAWWYLILKNQVGLAAEPGAAVGLMTTDSELTRIYDELTARELWTFGKLVQPDDDAFFEKVGGRYRRRMGLYGKMPDRALISRYLLRRWVDAWRPWAKEHEDGRTLLASRLEFIEPDPFKPEENVARAVSCPRPDACAARTLLPDIVRVMKPFRFFVIDSHRRPGTPEGDATPAYRAELAGYLARGSVRLVSLRKRAELHDARLWNDSKHVSPAGRTINTRLLAEELVSLRVIR